MNPSFGIFDDEPTGKAYRLPSRQLDHDSLPLSDFLARARALSGPVKELTREEIARRFPGKKVSR